MTKRTASNPTNKTKQSSQRTSFPIQNHIIRRIDQSKQEPIIEDQETPIQQLNSGVAEQRGRKIQKNQKCERNWPNEDHVEYYVHRVAVIGSIESKLFFQIKHSHLSLSLSLYCFLCSSIFISWCVIMWK